MLEGFDSNTLENISKHYIIELDFKDYSTYQHKLSSHSKTHSIEHFITKILSSILQLQIKISHTLPINQRLKVSKIYKRLNLGKETYKFENPKEQSIKFLSNTLSWFALK